MTSDDLARLVDQAGRDPALARALTAADSAADAVRVATDHGFTVTVEDLNQVTAPLSDSDLDLVAGGNVNQIFPTAPWVAC